MPLNWDVVYTLNQALPSGERLAGRIWQHPITGQWWAGANLLDAQGHIVRTFGAVSEYMADAKAKLTAQIDACLAAAG